MKTYEIKNEQEGVSKGLTYQKASVTQTPYRKMYW